MTTPRDTPSSAASARLDGSGVPARSRPSRIASRRRALELLVKRQLVAALELDQQVNWPSHKCHNWNCTEGQCRDTLPGMDEITVIGGGVAGLTAAICCAESGAPVRLLEAHETLGGRARSTDAPYKANLGPHAIYKGGVLWNWLSERNLMPPLAKPPLTGVRFRYEGAIHRTPPLTLIPPGLRLRGRMAPVDQDFRSWVSDHSDPRTADLLSALAGVYTFYHDPGELSAAFVWERTQRLLLSPRPPARFVVGGWSTLVDWLERRARSLGVAIVSGERVDAVPDAPAIVALELRDARDLLDDESLTWPSGRTSASISGCASSAATRGSSPTSRAQAGSSATAHRTPPWLPPASSSSRARCRSGPTRARTRRPRASSICSICRSRIGASGSPSAAAR